MTKKNMLDINDRYQRAQAILQGYCTDELVQNDSIFPFWIEGADCFWYERKTKIGKEYRLVDANARNNEAAFDHQGLAKALSQATGQPINKDNLPIAQVVIESVPLTVSFDAFDQRWIFDVEEGGCVASERLPVAGETPSPNGQYIAFVRDFNLWLRDRDSHEERPLTVDGIPDYDYGSACSAWGAEVVVEDRAFWSPDSNNLVTILRDKRQVLTSSIINHVPKGSLQPTAQTIKVAYPKDESVETYQFVAIDIVSGSIKVADFPPLPAGLSENAGLFLSRLLWWGKDNRLAYFIAQERGDRVVQVIEFDTHTGTTRVLFEERSETHINIVASDYVKSPLHRVLQGSHELIWWSERSGWGHLYLYDLQSGELKHAITQGEWLVRDVLFVDESRREILIQTAGRVQGRNPYYRDICRVSIDTGEIVTLLSSDEDIMVCYPEIYCVLCKTQGVSSSGDYLVITRSRVDRAPVTELLNREGERLLELEIADITALPTGWTWPESVEVLAADGVTPLYGVLYRPSYFDPKKSYPLINYVGSGPWLSMAPAGSFNNAGTLYTAWHYFNAAAIAELGFIVLQLDSRGTPLRGKAFQDHSYGWAPDAIDTQDHAVALQQLTTQYPAIDPERIGSFSCAYSGGLINFLECQDLYKVHVQASVLDVRLVGCTIKGDIWEGLDGPANDKCYPEQLVNKLRRKLLLMHPLFGHQANVYPLTATMRVVHALQKANKDFDLLMTPETGASFGHYSTRRIWDYFVKHLMGAEAPKEFKLKASILP